jgi:hypothetical protein
MNQNSNMYEILGKLNSISSPAQQPKAETKTQLQESAQHSQSQSPYDRLNEKYQRYVDRISSNDSNTQLNEKYMGFKKLEKSIADRGDVKDPGAVAASIGRKKYGKEKFQKAAAAGKKMGEGLSHTGTIKQTDTGKEYTPAPGHRVRATIGPGGGDPKVDFVKSEPSKGSQAAQPSSGKDKPVDESGLQAYLGKKKYGKEGMAALQQAGREGASKEKMAKIRARHDKMDEADMEEGNKFAYNVIKAKAAGKKRADLDGDGDMEPVREASKPDYLDFDKDGNKKEPMKKALKDKKAHAVEEGWDDMLKDVERRRTSPKVGSSYQGKKGEIERTSTGVRHTRRYDPETGETDSDDKAEPVKRGRGRPKSGSGPRQERVTAKSRKTDRTAHGQAGFKSGDKRKKEVEEAMETLRRCGYDVDKLEEKSVSKAQQKFMGMAHAMQKGEKIKGASPELKKVAKTMKKGDVEDFAKTKHKGLPQHVKPKKKTEEGSIEGGKRPGDLTGTWSADKPAKGKPNVPPPVPNDPVSPAKKPKSNTKKADAGGDQAVAETETTSSKGGMSFGKGIYDSLNRTIEDMIAETSQLNESISINTSISSEGNRNITINATDEDADKLAHILKLAGLSSEEKHDDVCPGCGSPQCGCDHLDEADVEVSNNTPDYPENMAQEDDTEFMTQTISGGLNKPKRDQTTLPHIAVKSVQSEGIERSLWNLYKKV